jgi:hypothetical protein
MKLFLLDLMNQFCISNNHKIRLMIIVKLNELIRHLEYKYLF